MSDPLRGHIWRDPHNETRLDVRLSREPTDGEMRHIHDILRDPGVTYRLIRAALAFDASAGTRDGDLPDAAIAYRKANGL